MMFMTTRVDSKKIFAGIAALAGIILGVILLFGGGEAEPTNASAVSGNDGRVQFLESFGWKVAASPTESGQVKIPKEMDEVFTRYNALQKTQGYDLSQYAGKTVMRYVYRVENYPGATEPVYATVLVHKGQVIGGDITDTAAGGKIRPFKTDSTDDTGEAQ